MRKIFVYMAKCTESIRTAVNFAHLEVDLRQNQPCNSYNRKFCASIRTKGPVRYPSRKGYLIGPYKYLLIGSQRLPRCHQLIGLSTLRWPAQAACRSDLPSGVLSLRRVQYPVRGWHCPSGRNTASLSFLPHLRWKAFQCFE